MPAALPPAWGLYFLPLDSVALSFPGRISTAAFSMAHALILANFPLHPPRIQVHVGRSEVTRKCIQNASNCNGNASVCNRLTSVCNGLQKWKGKNRMIMRFSGGALFTQYRICLLYTSRSGRGSHLPCTTGISGTGGTGRRTVPGRCACGRSAGRTGRRRPRSGIGTYPGPHAGSTGEKAGQARVPRAPADTPSGRRHERGRDGPCLLYTSRCV